MIQEIFEKKEIMNTYLFVTWLATYQWKKKTLKTAILLVQELIK